MGYCKDIKVCIISPLGYTGLAYYNHCLCQSLSEVGVDVTLVTSKKNIASPKKLTYKINEYFIGIYGHSNRLIKGFCYIFSMIRICLFVLHKKFKIIHFQILELPAVDLVFFVFLKLARKKIIFTPHDIFSFKFKYDKTIRGILYKISDVIIVHNQANKNLLIEEFKISSDRIEIVVHGNYNYFLHSNIQREDGRDMLGIARNKKVALLFGNIRQGKGIETVITAMGFLKNKEGFLLVIAGKPAAGYDMLGLKEKIKRYNLEDFILLKDCFIDDSLVEYYYKMSDLALIPYEQVYDSAVLRYAFSCEIPAIVSDIEVFSEFAVNNENCLIFRTGDAKDLAEKIEFAISDYKNLRRISQNAKKLSDTNWDWKTSATKTKTIYENL